MHRLTHAQTKEINEANNPNAPGISMIGISHQNNVGAANPNNAGTDNVSASEIVSRSEISTPNQDRLPQHTKTPKSYVPCPFLSRKGYCLKGSKCDFSHANPQQLFQPYQQQYFPPPFYGQTPYYLQSPPNAMRHPHFYPHMSAAMPVSTQENKHGIGPARNKIETAHGHSVPIFCSSLTL